MCAKLLRMESGNGFEKFMAEAWRVLHKKPEPVIERELILLRLKMHTLKTKRLAPETDHPAAGRCVSRKPMTSRQGLSRGTAKP